MLKRCTYIASVFVVLLFACSGCIIAENRETFSTASAVTPVASGRYSVVIFKNGSPAETLDAQLSRRGKLYSLVGQKSDQYVTGYLLPIEDAKLTSMYILQYTGSFGAVTNGIGVAEIDGNDVCLKSISDLKSISGLRMEEGSEKKETAALLDAGSFYSYLLAHLNEFKSSGNFICFSKKD